MQSLWESLNVTRTFLHHRCGFISTAECKRIPIDGAVAEYRGLPIRWFGTLIEFASCPFYQTEWRKLKQEINARRDTYNESAETYNCRPFGVALVLAEEKRYCDHSGVDPIGIARAIWQTLFIGNRQGASTIEQQLVRSLTHDYRKSIVRKFKEIVLASRIHRELDKERILIAYITVAYCGWRMNGIKEAAQ